MADKTIVSGSVWGAVNGAGTILYEGSASGSTPFEGVEFDAEVYAKEYGGGGGDGGGGGGGDEVVLVTLAAEWDSGDSICVFEADMEDDDIAAAIEDGKTVKCVISCDPDDADIGDLDGIELPVYSTVSSQGGSFPVFLGIVGDLTPTSMTKVTGTAAIAYFQEDNHVIMQPSLTLTLS